MTRFSTRLPIVLAAALACGEGTDAPNRVDVLPGGGLRVSNSGVPEWTPETAWQLDVDLRIGASDGDGPDVFGSIGDFVVGPAGAIYILDALAQEIRVFDATGAFSHRFGRQGRGPGEFVAAVDLHVGPRGRLLVRDGRGARYTIFDASGLLISTHQRRIFSWAFRGGFAPDGRFVDWGLSFPEEGPDVTAGPLVLYEPYRLSQAFDEVDSLPPITIRREMTADGARPQLFFAGEIVSSLDQAGRIWFADSRVYEVHQRTLEGDTTLVFSLPADPAPVTESDRDSIRAQLSPARAERYLADLPSQKPIVRHVFADDAGHVFVVPELATTPAGTVLDVFRDTGHYLGRLRLPLPMRISGSGALAAATEYHIYYVAADPLDIPILTRLTITR